MGKFDDLKQAAQATALAEEAAAKGWFVKSRTALIVGAICLVLGFILGKLF